MYFTKDRTRIEVTLNGSLIHVFKVWVNLIVAQDAILGMNFMVLDGIRPDLADETVYLPEELRIQISGRRFIHGIQALEVKLGQ